MKRTTRGPLSRTAAAVALAALCLLSAGCGSDGGGESGDSGGSSSGASSPGSDSSDDSGTASDASGGSDDSGGDDSSGDDAPGTDGDEDTRPSGGGSGDDNGPRPAEEPVGNCASYSLPASDQSPKSFSSGSTNISLRRGYDVSAQVVEATSDDGRYSGEYSLMSGDASFYDGQITVSIEYELVTGFDGQVTSEPVQKAHVCGWTED
ncbi:hypothetical protein [Streptomyces sp. NPDC059828]|uniref:hypothetical protein n=1 Tax=Streptomyces sp. NPDC059828 TaxID=3346965 RepID=UPI0036590792